MQAHTHRAPCTMRSRITQIRALLTRLPGFPAAPPFPQGVYLASCHDDGTVVIWNVEDGTLAKDLGKARRLWLLYSRELPSLAAHNRACVPAPLM